MPAWLMVWVVSVVDAMVAVAGFISRNPTVRQKVGDWLTTYGKYASDKVLYLWQWATIRFTEAEMSMVDRSEFVKRVLQEGEQDLFDLMRWYGIANDQARSLMSQLANNVTTQLINDIMNRVPPPGRFPMPPNLPPWYW